MKKNETENDNHKLKLKSTELICVLMEERNQERNSFYVTDSLHMIS